MIETLVNVLRTGIVFLLVITVLVFVHELGHYWSAKMFGMKVDAFAVMVGGVRKTDLGSFLKRKLVPSWVLWLIGVVAALVALAGATEGIPLLFYAGMLFLTVVGPVWVILRLSALYHQPVWQGAKTLGLSWLAVCVILFLGTGFRNLDIGYVLGLLLAGSAVAVMVQYYSPISRKPEDSPQGFGEITVEGEDVSVRYRPVWYRTDKHGTEFSLLLLPLGGFAAIHGMHLKPDGSEAKTEGGFYSKPAFHRFITLLAGPVFSIVFGVALLNFVFVAHGQAVPVPVIKEFAPTSAAKQAGLQEGDKFLAINGSEVTDYYDFITSIRYAYDTVDGKIVPRKMKFDVMRDGEAKTVYFAGTLSQSPEVVLGKDLQPTGQKEYQVRLGILPDVEFKPMPFGEAFSTAVQTPGVMASVLAQSVSSAAKAKENIGGPRATAEGTSQAVNEGIWSVLAMAAGLSIVLGITNLIPVPPLDGGQMLIAFIEMLRGNRRIAPAIQGTVHTIGFFLVMVLMLAPIVIDASRKADENQASAMYGESKKP